MMGGIDFIAIFMTGLLAGGLTCMAVQGGLLAATIAQQEQKRLEEGLKKKGNAMPILLFLDSKILVYTALGLLLGWFGSFFTLSLQVQIVLYIAVGIFMIGTALNILDVHPVFRYFLIQPPHFLTRFIRKQSKKNDLLTPVFLGALTVFIPCGTTQAMMALAIASGNPLYGALIMFIFTLGTSPVFFTLGYLATRLTGALHTRFMKIAAFAIILLALFNINNALTLSGTGYTLGSILKTTYCVFSFCDGRVLASVGKPVAEATIEVTDAGYYPRELWVKAGEKITLTLDNPSARGCAQAFTIPSLGVQKIVRTGMKQTVTFEAPAEKEDLAFMCTMGMYEGVMHVI
ncbi:MAG: sulfite exporter TauE/SafE family protein [Candidatus Levybacteria bacterium]|nr:sulfite exporter TauE/SafE family protein [Candidatus Levybacteria bacterium]